MLDTDSRVHEQTMGELRLGGAQNGTKKPENLRRRTRKLLRDRGNGEIYDVIDEWLASLFARIIAIERGSVIRESEGEQNVPGCHSKK